MRLASVFLTGHVTLSQEQPQSHHTKKGEKKDNDTVHNDIYDYHLYSVQFSCHYNTMHQIMGALDAVESNANDF